MCVGSVCTQPSYNDKNPPSVFFFNLLKSLPLSQIEPISDACLCDCHTDPGPSHDCLIVWLVFYLRPALSDLSSVRHCFTAGLLSDWGVLLLDVIMNIAVVIYSRHLSRWRHSGLRLFLKGIPLPIYLNAFMFTRIIRDPASPTEEVSIRFFLWIFPNLFQIPKYLNYT